MNSYGNDYSRIPGSGVKSSSKNTSKKLVTLSIIGFYIVVGCFFLISILAIILYYNQPSSTTSSKSQFNSNLYNDSSSSSSYSKLFNVMYSVSVFIYVFITFVVAIMAWNKTQVSYSDSIQITMSIVLTFTTILTLLN